MGTIAGWIMLIVWRASKVSTGRALRNGDPEAAFQAVGAGLQAVDTAVEYGVTPW